MTEHNEISDLQEKFSEEANYSNSNTENITSKIHDVNSLSESIFEISSHEGNTDSSQCFNKEEKTLNSISNTIESSGDSGVSLDSKNSTPEDEWLDIMGSGNFKKLTLKKGLGHETRPDRGDRVTVRLEYFLNDKLIDQHENLLFIVGDMDVIQALDLVVCLMEKDEIAKVKIPAKLAYGKIGRVPDIPPESDLECEVHLKDIQALDLDSLTILEKLKLGDEKRARGNFFYERTEFLDAIFCYERAIEYLESIRDSSGSSPEDSQKIVDMKIKVYNNLAASHLKLSAYQAALKSVESVLNVQPKNVKALFRKAKIHSAEGSTDEAIACLRYASNLEPDTKVFQTELAKLKSKKLKEGQSQKEMYKRMFPQSEPKKPTSSFKKSSRNQASDDSHSKNSFAKWFRLKIKKISSVNKTTMTLSAVTAGIMALVGGVAAYRYLHS